VIGGLTIRSLSLTGTTGGAVSTFWLYVRIQLFMLLCGLVGPIFLLIYFFSGPDPELVWMLWGGLAVLVFDVLIAVGLTAYRTRAAARAAALEQYGVLALAKVAGIHEMHLQMNHEPLVKLDLHISGEGITPFSTHDRVVASPSRRPTITARKLVVLVNPTTNDYQIDWQRSALVNGLTPVPMTLTEDGKTYDLTGQADAMLEVLQVVRLHKVNVDKLDDLREANPAAHQQVLTIARNAAARASASPSAITSSESTAAQRLQELETLRSTGSLTDAEYTAKRQQVIADL
jgi:hypothetical protein